MLGISLIFLFPVPRLLQLPYDASKHFNVVNTFTLELLLHSFQYSNGLFHIHEVLLNQEGFIPDNIIWVKNILSETRYLEYIVYALQRGQQGQSICNRCRFLRNLKWFNESLALFISLTKPYAPLEWGDFQKYMICNIKFSRPFPAICVALLLTLGSLQFFVNSFDHLHRLID